MLRLFQSGGEVRGKREEPTSMFVRLPPRSGKIAGWAYEPPRQAQRIPSPRIGEGARLVLREDHLAQDCSRSFVELYHSQDQGVSDEERRDPGMARSLGAAEKMTAAGWSPRTMAQFQPEAWTKSGFHLCPLPEEHVKRNRSE